MFFHRPWFLFKFSTVWYRLVSLSLSVFPPGSHLQPGKATNSAEERGGGRGHAAADVRHVAPTARPPPTSLSFFSVSFSPENTYSPEKNKRKRKVGREHHALSYQRATNSARAIPCLPPFPPHLQIHPYYSVSARRGRKGNEYGIGNCKGYFYLCKTIIVRYPFAFLKSTVYYCDLIMHGIVLNSNVLHICNHIWKWRSFDSCNTYHLLGNFKYSNRHSSVSRLVQKCTHLRSLNAMLRFTTPYKAFPSLARNESKFLQ